MKLCATRYVVADGKHFGTGGSLSEDSQTVLRVLGAYNSCEYQWYFRLRRVLRVTRDRRHRRGAEEVRIHDCGNVYRVSGYSDGRVRSHRGSAARATQTRQNDCRLHRQEHRKRPRGYAGAVRKQKCAPLLRCRESFEP